MLLRFVEFHRAQRRYLKVEIGVGGGEFEVVHHRRADNAGPVANFEDHLCLGRVRCCGRERERADHRKHRKPDRRAEPCGTTVSRDPPDALHKRQLAFKYADGSKTKSHRRVLAEFEEPDQRRPIPLGVPDEPEHPFIASHLPVFSCTRHGKMNRGIKPMERRHQPAQPCHPEIAPFHMGEFMEKHHPHFPGLEFRFQPLRQDDLRSPQTGDERRIHRGRNHQISAPHAKQRLCGGELLL